VILLDGYPGDDAAELEPSFDPNVFPAALAERGFDVERNSRSNYLLTTLTISSMFGGNHIADIPALGPPHGPSAADYRRLRRFSETGAVLRDARRARGYERIASPSSAGRRRALRRPTGSCPTPALQELEFGLLRITTLGKLIDLVFPDFMAGQYGTNVMGVIHSTERIASEPHERPRFVFSHVTRRRIRRSCSTRTGTPSASRPRAARRTRTPGATDLPND
jgi:hypothetical protein